MPICGLVSLHTKTDNMLYNARATHLVVRLGSCLCHYLTYRSMCALKFELRTGRENEATAISAPASPPPPPQKILAVRPYLVEYRAIGDCPCVNSRTGECLFVQRMDLKAFMLMGYILLHGC